MSALFGGRGARGVKKERREKQDETERDRESETERSELKRHPPMLHVTPVGCGCYLV